MKLSRDLGGEKLARSLKKFGYHITHQSGSHMRLTTMTNGEHHITIPKHSPLKVGTLNNILNEVAEHLEIEKNELIQRLKK